MSENKPKYLFIGTVLNLKKIAHRCNKEPCSCNKRNKIYFYILIPNDWQEMLLNKARKRKLCMLAHIFIQE